MSFFAQKDILRSTCLILLVSQIAVGEVPISNPNISAPTFSPSNLPFHRSAIFVSEIRSVGDVDVSTPGESTESSLTAMYSTMKIRRHAWIYFCADTAQPRQWTPFSNRVKRRVLAIACIAIANRLHTVRSAFFDKRIHSHYAGCEKVLLLACPCCFLFLSCIYLLVLLECSIIVVNASHLFTLFEVILVVPVSFNKCLRSFLLLSSIAVGRNLSLDRSKGWSGTCAGPCGKPSRGPPPSENLRYCKTI